MNVFFDTNELTQDKFVVLFDPLDGSSNIDTNAPIGTIFSIYLVKKGKKVERNDFLQISENLVCSGYMIYGSSTMLVYTTGRGVHGFTLDSAEKEFLLSHFDIKTPKTANFYSINHGRQKSWSNQLNKFAEWCGTKNDDKNEFSLRYIGSMVADFHRIRCPQRLCDKRWTNRFWNWPGFGHAIHDACRHGLVGPCGDSLGKLELPVFALAPACLCFRRRCFGVDADISSTRIDAA